MYANVFRAKFYRTSSYHLTSFQSIKHSTKPGINVTLETSKITGCVTIGFSCGHAPAV